MRQGSRLNVNLRYLEDNLNALNSFTSTCSEQVIAMVKANAYGHGISEITDFSFQELGIKSFGVASLGEGLYLREKLNSFKQDIYVFSDYSFERHNELELFSENKLIPVLYSIKKLREFLSSSSSKRIPLCIKFDTGMNRLGIKMSELSEALSLLKKYQRKSIYHLMSHLANSGLSLEKHTRNKLQIDQYLGLVSRLKDENITIECTSFSNSGAIEQAHTFHSSHIRPGLMLYGISGLNNKNDRKLRLKTLSTLEADIIHQFKVDKGEPVGYGSHPVIHEGYVAVVALGYGDGFLNCYKGHSVQSESGKKGRVLKPVNMDMTQILFKEPLDDREKVFLWREGQDDVRALSEMTGMIPYEVMCCINERVPRRYRYPRV